LVFGQGGFADDDAGFALAADAGLAAFHAQLVDQMMENGGGERVGLVLAVVGALFELDAVDDVGRGTGAQAIGVEAEVLADGAFLGDGGAGGAAAVTER